MIVFSNTKPAVARQISFSFSLTGELAGKLLKISDFVEVERLCSAISSLFKDDLHLLQEKDINVSQYKTFFICLFPHICYNSLHTLMDSIVLLFYGWFTCLLVLSLLFFVSLLLVLFYSGFIFEN